MGNPAAGPNNVYVTDKPISLGVKPVIESGDDKTLVGGCDCIISAYKGRDKLKRFEFELDLGVLEPALLEMLTGADVILDGADPIGVWWASQLSCADAQQPNVCIEGWQDLWDDDHQETAATKYAHWIWPSTYWQIGAHTLENDFLQPKLEGFSRGNPEWGLGIFGDLPEAAGPLGGFFYQDTLPTAACGYQSFAIT